MIQNGHDFEENGGGPVRLIHGIDFLCDPGNRGKQADQYLIGVQASSSHQSEKVYKHP